MEIDALNTAKLFSRQQGLLVAMGQIEKLDIFSCLFQLVYHLKKHWSTRTAWTLVKAATGVCKFSCW